MAPHQLLNDRFSLCLMLAVSIHALLLLGVSFGIDLRPAQKLAESLDIVLVNWQSETDPEDPDFLAQASQKGGGESEEKAVPSQRESGLFPKTQEGDAAIQSTPALPEPEIDKREVIARESDTSEVPLEVNQIDQPDTARPNTARLLRQSMEMANLQPDTSRKIETQSKLPRREFISANTRAYEFASYMSAWVGKVERVGNLNYPTELRQKKLHGDLVLTVGIDWNGDVESVEVRRSSGSREIDEAAIEIVRLASPYAPLPDNIRETVDILHITRTWRFEAAFGVN
jgi:protein TonB